VALPNSEILVWMAAKKGPKKAKKGQRKAKEGGKK